MKVECWIHNSVIYPSLSANGGRLWTSLQDMEVGIRAGSDRFCITAVALTTHIADVDENEKTLSAARRTIKPMAECVSKENTR
jgi:hypothetical protein